MGISRIITSALAIAMGICGGLTAQADVLWTVTGGKTLVSFDADALEEAGLSVVLTGSGGFSQPTNQAILEIDGGSTLAVSESDGIISSPGDGVIHHADGLVLSTSMGEVALDGFAMTAANSSSDMTFTAADGGLVFGDAKLGFDRVARILMVEGSEMVISESLALALGSKDLAGTVVGTFTIQADLDWAGGDTPFEQEELDGDSDGDVGTDGGTGGTVCGRPLGADVIVGALHDIDNYASVGNIEAFAVGTISCNVGDETLQWFSTINRHPVIGQNMYRLKNDQIELIGISFLKHGFTALAENTCGCGCIPPGTGTLLGVGCSDPYSAFLNGQQNRLGPRFEVNAHTGHFEYPYTFQGMTGSSIYKRLQVHISDLDPAQDGGGIYFVEGQYVTPDDAANGNQDNNASYRRVVVSGAGSTWNVTLSTAATVREEPAIRAWKTSDPTVVETDVRVPDEGLLIMAAKASDLGGGMWHYEYAVHNLNSDRSVGSFSVPLPGSATVTNIGFHDVDYHSGEPYDGTDWPGVHAGGAVTWSTEDYSANVNANALRWGTMYNFRFDADVPPAETNVTLGLFKPGTPTSVDAVTTGPSGCASTSACPDADVNCDNLTDGFDVAEIRNTANWLVDADDAAEPRADVNGDGIIDGFDIAAVRSTACWLQ